jgi:hypothetical protein
MEAKEFTDELVQDLLIQAKEVCRHVCATWEEKAKAEGFTIFADALRKAQQELERGGGFEGLFDAVAPIFVFVIPPEQLDEQLSSVLDREPAKAEMVNAFKEFLANPRIANLPNARVPNRWGGVPVNL